MKLSIIIPTLDEGGSLERTLKALQTEPREIIVVDGGSRDGTVEIARQYTPHVLISRRGRGRQQHKGACHSKGDLLLFLHSDTLLPLGFESMIREALIDPRVTFGAFRLSIDPPRPAFRFIALMANFRSQFLKMPYGDQALFMRRSDYFRVGGFKDIPLMEDVDMVQRLNKIGRFKLTRCRVKTSARRWEKEGILCGTLRNWSLIGRYLLGTPPHRLRRHYTDSK